MYCTSIDIPEIQGLGNIEKHETSHKVDTRELLLDLN